MKPGTVVVTGGGGTLGRRLCGVLARRGWRVCGLGRGSAPEGFGGAWSRVDLVAGDGLAEALRGADVVVHAASAPFANGEDVRAARQLARCVREAGVSHIVYVQIAGIAEAAKGFAYYRDKLAAEAVLRDAGVPCAVAAATQFHDLVDRIFRALAAGPVMPLPRFALRPVDVGFFAERVADLAIAPDKAGVRVCGPEMLTSRDMADAWLAARTRRRLIVPIPTFGVFRAFARLDPFDGITGGQTWKEWLARFEKEV